MTQQQRNPEMVNLLTADFIHKRDNAYLWALLPGAYLMLSELRGFWPMSASDEGPNVMSLVNGAAMVKQGGPTYGTWGLAPYVALAANAYLRSALDTALDTTGALTAGLWVWLDTFGTPIMGIWETPGEGWQIYSNSGGTLSVKVEGGGGSTVYTTTTAAAVSSGAWHFVVARYRPSTELALCVDGTWTRNVTSIPASITNPTKRLAIGTNSDASGTRMTGRVSLAFLCHAALTDLQVAALWGLGHPVFGVNPAG